MLLLLVTQQAFSEQVSTNKGVNIKAFPDNNINYFFKKNKAEAWRLVYAEFANTPDDPNDDNHCNSHETAPDKTLAFNISEVIKNTGHNFNTDNFHAYYDGDSGGKALALLLSDPRLKNSFFALGKALIGQGDSEYAVLTPARLKKSVAILHDDEENRIYMCFGYLQQIITRLATHPIEKEANTTDINISVNPLKIVLWYDGAKAAPTYSPPIKQTQASSSKVSKKAHKIP
jgi:hypothetical protein